MNYISYKQQDPLAYLTAMFACLLMVGRFNVRSTDTHGALCEYHAAFETDVNKAH